MTQDMHILVGMLYTGRVPFADRAMASLTLFIRPEYEYTILMEAYRLFFAFFAHFLYLL